jgi:SAM-dependent MidA family methyltransferase
MIRIIKTIKVKADYDITKEFDSVEDLMSELKTNYGYEGEYDEENQEFIDALNEYFDEPMYCGGIVDYGNQHRIDDIQVDTDNFETYYTLR